MKKLQVPGDDISNEVWYQLDRIYPVMAQFISTKPSETAFFNLAARRTIGWKRFAETLRTRDYFEDTWDRMRVPPFAYGPFAFRQARADMIRRNVIFPLGRDAFVFNASDLLYSVLKTFPRKSVGTNFKRYINLIEAIYTEVSGYFIQADYPIQKIQWQIDPGQTERVIKRRRRKNVIPIGDKR